MLLQRIDNNKNMNQEVERVSIELNGARYEITENHGKLNISKQNFSDFNDDAMAVYPCVSNVVEVK